MPAISDINDLQNMALNLAGDYWLLNDIDATPTATWNFDPALGIYKGFDPVGIRSTNMVRRPIGDHSSGGGAWTIFPADGIMWDKVNEVVPDEDARYIMATISGSWALFNFAPFNIPADATITAVYIFMRVRKIAAGTSDIRGYLRVGGGNYQYGLSAWNPSETYANRNLPWTWNPKTGLPWTVDEVNGIGADALEAFGAIVTDASPNVRITQAYIWVMYDRPFRGSLNGNGHTISNLYINRPNDNVGLFGYVDLGANRIKDLKLTNVNMRGYGIGTLAYAFETGNVSGVDIEGNLTVGSDCGGLVNYILTSGQFSDCNVNVTILAGSCVEIGGFACLGGNMQFTDINVVISIQSFGACPIGKDNVIGGFIGDTWGPDQYTRCYVSGSIYAEGQGEYGGFTGYSAGTSTWDNCETDINITLSTVDQDRAIEAGGFIAYTCSDEIFNNCHAKGDITITALRPQHDNWVGGFISFTCTNEHLNYCTATGNVTVTHNESGHTAWIGGFIAFSCDTEHFESCGATGDVTLNLNGIFTNTPDVGGFVGFICATEIYEKCYAAGDVSVTIIGSVGGAWNTEVGGFAGYYWTLQAIILNCYSVGNVTVIADDAYIGGFIGYTRMGGLPITADISNCYSAGIVSVTGIGNRVGGCITAWGGELPPITAVFWDTEKSGQPTSDGGIGKTTSEMNCLATFTGAGWDFTSIWNLIPGEVTTVKAGNITAGSAILDGLLDQTIINDGYPILRWQPLVILPCNCGFEWGETEAFGNFTPLDSKNTGESFIKILAGLKPSTTYYYRARASQSPGPIHGGTKSFTTLHAIEVETLPATNITENSARIWGRVRKVPVTAIARFDWGGNIEYGAETPWAQGLVSDDTFFYDLRNLAEGRAYHFRAMAMGSALVYGNDMTFTTRSPVGPVTLIQEELAHLMEVS